MIGVPASLNCKRGSPFGGVGFQAVYPPGLSIRFVFDDATLLWANHGDARLMTSYRASLEALIRALRFERVLRPPVRLLWLSWICSALYGEGQRELATEQAERVSVKTLSFAPLVRAVTRMLEG